MCNFQNYFGKPLVREFGSDRLTVTTWTEVGEKHGPVHRSFVVLV